MDGSVRTPAARVACTDSVYSDEFTPGFQRSEAVRTEAATTVAAMNLDERANQMQGTTFDAQNPNYALIYESPPSSPQFDIAGWEYRDGPRGVSLEGACPAIGTGCFATTFPVSIARGATWDVCLEGAIGKAMGDETLASANTMLLSPMVNLLRHTGWGRSQEGYSEDPFHTGRMGGAHVVGVQNHIPACVKHYMGNNIENDRQELNVNMDDQTMHEIYGRAFEMIVRDAGVAVVMAAYNRVNGAKSTANRSILTDMLRGDFGYQGITITDWWALEGSTNTNNVVDIGANLDVAPAALNAGLDMEVPWIQHYGRIQELVGSNEVAEAVIQDAARRIIETKLEFNVARGNQKGLARPTTSYNPGTGSITNNSQHITLAYQAALEGTVLLKNDNNTLPIDTATVREIAVLSADVPFDLAVSGQAFEDGVVNFATSVLTGDEGSSRMRADPALSYSPLAGLQERVAGLTTPIQIVSGTSANVAANSDFVLVFAGLNPQDEGEEYTGAGDRSTFAMDAKLPPGSGTPQEDLIRAAAALGKPMAVVLIGGGVIDMPWLADVPAVLDAWYPGMVGGLAIADLVLGTVSPSGKLPISWVTWDQAPSFVLQQNSIDLEYFVGYRYYENAGITPLYPFGHGLSYATFDYQNLEVPCSTVTAGGVVDVSVDVTNSGSVAADEVVMMFASYPDSTDPRKRIKKLQGFYRVSLAAGEAKKVTIPLRVNEMRFWNEAAGDDAVDPGNVLIEVGRSIGDIRATEMLVVQ